MKKSILGHFHAPLLSGLLLTALQCLGSASADEVRTWTDNQGRSVDATLVRVNETNVVIRLKDGREMDYPIERLSAADVKYIGEFREASKNGGAPSSAQIQKNFELPWPERISFKEDPEIEVIEQNAETQRFIYESANYRYVCDVRLSSSVVRGFARLFETTHLYCLSLPIGFTGGTKVDGKYTILLVEKLEDYMRAGGLPGSAGVYMSGRNLIMVPLTSLGVRLVGRVYILDRDQSNKTLPHEITHQLTPVAYFRSGSMGWFIEGIAEYISLTPYTSGTYNVKSNLRSIVQYVTSHSEDHGGGLELGTKITMPPLEKFFMQEYSTFLANAQRNYGCSTLLVYYFFHMDGEGDAKRIKAFLKAMHEGKEGKEALNSLLDGRSFQQLEKEIQEAWSRKGLDISFDGVLSDE